MTFQASSKMANCKKCKKEFDNTYYPENDMCRECYFKWKERALRCKGCKNPIDWHNYHWHGKLCDECWTGSLNEKPA